MAERIGYDFRAESNHLVYLQFPKISEPNACAMRILLCEIERQAAGRPGGYRADVLANGRIVGDELEMSEETYRELVAKYDPKRFPVLPRRKQAITLTNDVHQIHF